MFQQRLPTMFNLQHTEQCWNAHRENILANVLMMFDQNIGKDCSHINLKTFCHNVVHNVGQTVFYYGAWIFGVTFSQWNITPLQQCCLINHENILANVLTIHHQNIAEEYWHIVLKTFCHNVAHNVEQTFVTTALEC